jgi:hypothetical protein
MTHRQPMADLVETAAVLQANVNLHIGWAMITDLRIPPELVDANAKLVEVSCVLREAARQALEDATCRRPDRPAAVPPLARLRALADVGLERIPRQAAYRDRVGP